MTILVTGATGRLGSQIIAGLARRGADIRALTRDPAKARLPDGVAVVGGDLADIDATRAALRGVSTLFLL
ncbi:MAG: NmrA family NAD(P)-binding protein, partial [Caulobacteraceae bacterium]|nr:NmrA family NAD(P)-binding protein [Caulobacter sp.]